METKTVGPDLEGAMLRTVLESVSSGQDGVTPGAFVDRVTAYQDGHVEIRGVVPTPDDWRPSRPRHTVGAV